MAEKYTQKSQGRGDREHQGTRHFSMHRFIADQSPDNRDLRRSLLAGDRDTRFKAALRLRGLSIYDLNRNQSVCANLLHRFLHLEIDVATRERIYMVGRCQANGNNRVGIQFRACEAWVEAVCHQTDFFKFRTDPRL